MRPIDGDRLREFMVRAGRLVKHQDDHRAAAKLIGKLIAHLDKEPTIQSVSVEELERRWDFLVQECAIYSQLWAKDYLIYGQYNEVRLTELRRDANEQHGHNV